MKRKIFFLCLGLLSLGAAAFLSGCSTILIFDPKGPIGDTIRFVIIAAIVLMAIVVIPVFVLNFWFMRKYSASQTGSNYTPEWHYSRAIDFTMWGIPIIIVGLLAYLTVSRIYEVDPWKPIASPHQPVNIQVVALDWKWLFIYPEENIATVSGFTFPVLTPLSFRLTSDTVMTSFFIPQLGSQIYAMSGMRSHLHLMADHAQLYYGHNQQFSGKEYGQMWFRAEAVSPEEYQIWLQKVRQSPEKLDLKRYAELTSQSVIHPPIYFSAVQPDLFGYILSKYRASPGKPALSHGAVPPAAGMGNLEGK